jgi:Uma2 family endonuclease
MATTAVRVSLDEYLNTSYEPDCDYVDGILEERNVGKNRHSATQSLVVVFLFAQARELGLKVMTEQRIQVSPTRVRIPDVCLIGHEDRDEVTQHPPALWVEILSPEDRLARVQTRLQEALQFGVQTIWVVDPYSKRAWIMTPAMPIANVTDGILRCTNPELAVNLKDILPED